ncbi:hypothetical protein ABZS88_40510 [Streptomyces sp. NPDC005480]|uniref:hypothetical protein n=1 Tax=Streptomyces sp. NPDC005480 TaxID=3154880 RepID=UPI0033B5BF73
MSANVEEKSPAVKLSLMDRRLFSPGELAICAVSIAGAVVGVIALASGWISL